jgi:Ca-activated chloride channel family protein
VPGGAAEVTGRRVATLLAIGLALAAIPACGNGNSDTTLRVLASSELADLGPLLDELHQETGVRLSMEYQGTVDASNALTPGKYQHDIAWLSSDRYFQLKLKQSGYAGPTPERISTMASPVVVGLKPKAAAAARAASADGQPTWADLADLAAAGSLRFGMASPQHNGSGLDALIGVATAAAGSGGTLRAEDLVCDRLRGFWTGHRAGADTDAGLLDEYVRQQDGLDGMIGYESTLLTGNSRVREQLEIVYPRDGMVLAEYPMLLLDPAKQQAYQRVTDWLRSDPVQKKISDRTLRRPLKPDVPRDNRLAPAIGNALYYPNRKEIVDQLIERYASPAVRTPDHVIFVLDYSLSMRGGRVAGLRSAFAGLTGERGADTTASGKFTRFYQGERITLLRFAGTVLEERDVTVGGAADLTALREFVGADNFAERTAIWSALDHAYRKAADTVAAEPHRHVSVVLMTDGENNAGFSVDEFLARRDILPSRGIRTYAIRFGEADPAALGRVGTMVDANATSLRQAFKEIRGCL